MVNSLIPHNRYVKENEFNKLFCLTFWESFLDRLKVCLESNIAKKESDIGLLARKYFGQCRDIRGWALLFFLPDTQSIEGYRDEWRCSLQELCYEFIRLYHKGILHGNSVSNLSKDINDTVDKRVSKYLHIY